jgi:predicted ATPase
MIAERAAGNPFFAEEIVRELGERGVLRGNPR